MNDDDFLTLMDALWGVGGGDLLMPPPGFATPLPPGRDDYQPRPFPIDPDEEVTW